MCLQYCAFASRQSCQSNPRLRYPGINKILCIICLLPCRPQGMGRIEHTDCPHSGWISSAGQVTLEQDNKNPVITGPKGSFFPWPEEIGTDSTRTESSREKKMACCFSAAAGTRGWKSWEPAVAGNISWLCFPKEVSALSLWELFLLQGSLQLGFPAEAGSTDTFHPFLSASPAWQTPCFCQCLRCCWDFLCRCGVHR